jgi:hypothetical protein
MVKKITFSLFLLISISLGLLAYPRQKIKSIPPSNVSDTLSSSQLSYFARLGAGNTEGSNFVRIATWVIHPTLPITYLTVTSSVLDKAMLPIPFIYILSPILVITSFFQVELVSQLSVHFAGSYVVLPDLLFTPSLSLHPSIHELVALGNSLSKLLVEMVKSPTMACPTKKALILVVTPRVGQLSVPVPD